ncbi:uncharacterized protein LOC122820679 [Gambusia affinis]|uniref:uncharacterized protein LOC122820679 n=1 Tax=Gambusia affinis TaxID=33528 RepID=UPI001CDBD1D5|nr:uncharacterized protein LOC122820679 [Gambusia affinis]
MGETLLCRLGFFLLWCLCCGYSEVPITPTVIQQPNWAQIYRGERVTLRCEIQDDGGSQWTYEWKPTNRNSPTSSEIMITADSRRDYRCRGRRNSFTFTEWGVVTLTVFLFPPQPVLSVSPSWPNPGASVTLNCEGLELQSAGWRFFWYKTVPDWSKQHYQPSYSYELLPGSINGTEQNSFNINGPTLTAGFVCRAERGEPKFYTRYSEVKFVWSADSAAASLSVNPDRVQHFRSESVTLTCKGNSTEWRVMKFIERDHLSSCSYWGTMTGSTCTINMNWSPSGVFWCESGSGEFSNAVNITVHVSSPVSSSFPVMLIVKPVVGITFGFLLLLILCFRPSKDLRCFRSKGSSQSSTTNQGPNQTESQVYSSLLHRDASEYESIQPATMNRSSDDPEDDSVCSCIKTETTETTEC